MIEIVVLIKVMWPTHKAKKTMDSSYFIYLLYSFSRIIPGCVCL